MRVAVSGVGAVGAYFGWRLIQSGEEVVFIARGETLQALQSTGLRVDTPDGASVVEQVQAYGDPAQAGHVDAVILGVKTWQVRDAAEAMKPLIGPETFVVPLQNGVEAPDQLASVLGQDHVFGGLCYMVCKKVGPGHIRHEGMEPRILFGELDNRPSDRGQKLLDAFLRSGLKAEMPADIHAAMWEKFLFIAGLSGVAAVSRALVGVLRSIPETLGLLEEVLKEIVGVARARGINLREDALAATLRVIDGLPVAATTSMQRDIMDNRPSELAAHNGAVVRMAKELGLLAPLNGAIYAALLPQELRARGEVSF